VSEPILLDGVLDEPAWQSSPRIGNLVQRIPTEGAVPSERTEVTLLRDADHLYIGVMCHDSEPDRILASQMARDASLRPDDYVELLLDTFRDQSNAYHFSTNPNGALVDGLVFANGETNEDWDAIWNVATQRSDRGWSAEFAIPFKSLNFPPDGTVWGFNISRNIQRKFEEARWAGARFDAQFFQVSEAGEITGLGGLEQGLSLDIRPFVAGRWDYSAGSGDDSLRGKPGLDLFYNVTPNLKLTATFNTDFGETEVDARQINLTRFSIFFPEKRSFFLQDAGVFNFATTGVGQPGGIPGTGAEIFPFFSRRIGLLRGREVPLNYGLKLTGRVGRTEVGVLNVGSRDTSFAQTDYRVTGVVDLSEGLDLLADAELTERLGGNPLGQPMDDSDLSAALAGVTVDIVLDLPAGVDESLTIGLGEAAQKIEMTAQEESVTAETLRWVAWAAFALVGLSVLIAVAGYLLERRARERSAAPTVPGAPMLRAPSPVPDQPPNRRLRLVVLNPLGVLFEPAEEPARLLVQFAAQRGVEADAENAENLHNRAVLGRIAPADLWAGIGLDDDPAELTEEFLSQYTVRSGARDFMEEMARRELPVDCLTNGVSDWSSALRDRLEIVGVETWIVSSDVGVLMPAPGIYEALRRTTAVPYENSLLVDIRVDHLDAARALGMSTALLAESRPPDSEAPGHAVVTSFSDFFRRRPRR